MEIEMSIPGDCQKRKGNLSFISQGLIARKNEKNRRSPEIEESSFSKKVEWRTFRHWHL
jgi:hypothetical protein